MAGKENKKQTKTQHDINAFTGKTNHNHIQNGSVELHIVIVQVFAIFFK